MFHPFFGEGRGGRWLYSVTWMLSFHCLYRSELFFPFVLDVLYFNIKWMVLEALLYFGFIFCSRWYVQVIIILTNVKAERQFKSVFFPSCSFMSNLPHDRSLVRNVYLAEVVFLSWLRPKIWLIEKSVHMSSRLCNQRDNQRWWNDFPRFRLHRIVPGCMVLSICTLNIIGTKRPHKHYLNPDCYWIGGKTACLKNLESAWTFLWFWRFVEGLWLSIKLEVSLKIFINEWMHVCRAIRITLHILL